MDSWIKYFSDSSTEIGSDFLIQNKQASWSKGRLDSIIKVQIISNNYTVELCGSGNWWQSDDFIAKIHQQPIRIRRRIQKQIFDTDCFIVADIKPEGTAISVCDILNIADSKKFYKIPRSYVGCWCVVEINEQTLKTCCYLSKEKI